MDLGRALGSRRNPQKAKSELQNCSVYLSWILRKAKEDDESQDAEIELIQENTGGFNFHRSLRFRPCSSSLSLPESIHCPEEKLFHKVHLRLHRRSSITLKSLSPCSVFAMVGRTQGKQFP